MTAPTENPEQRRKSVRNMRQLSSVMVDAKGQLRLFVPLAILLCGSMTLVITLYRVMASSLGEFTQLASAECITVLANFIEVLYRLEIIVSVGFIGLGILTFVLGIFYSHRIYGPKVALIRQVKSLIEGDYSAEAKLRKHDEFQDLAAELNRLAQSLRERHGQK